LKLGFDALPAHLQKQLLHAYLVSGDEVLVAGEAADAIRAKARAEGFTERDVHFLDRSSDWSEVRAAARTLSLFASRRLIEVRLQSGKAGVAGGTVLRSLIEDADPETLLLILTPRLDRDGQAAEWVRAVETCGVWVQVWPVDPGRLVGWLRARGRRMQLDLTEDALELLAARTEGNLLAADQELAKLSLLGLKGRISAETVLESVADSARFDVFQLNEAVLAGEAERALRILASLRGEGAELVLTLWALTKAMRDLWNGLAHPQGGSAQTWQRRQNAALEKGLRRARSLAFDQLAVRAERVDRMIKGRLEGQPWDEMALLALEICGRPVLAPARDALRP
jgi:DNA polymerase III subunit delta